MYPGQSHTTHTEQLGEEASVYDWARAQVHALNPTAARVWRLCDGATSPRAIAAALRVEMGIPEAEAVVDLTLAQLARVHLLEVPVESRGDRPATTRRWLLSRGVVAAMLPAIYSIVAPSPVEAQSPAGGAPTLSSVSPNLGLRGTTVAVTLTGTNFDVGSTTVAVAGGGVTVTNVTVIGATSQTAAVRRRTSLTAAVSSGTSLTANFVIDPAAEEGPRTVTVTSAGGTSGGQVFTVSVPLPPGTPTLATVSPNQGIRGATVAVTLTGTNFVVGATTVAVGGSGATVANVAVSSRTLLTANFVIDLAAAEGPRTVTVTTAIGTSGPRIFTIGLPLPTLTSVAPNQGVRGSTVGVILTGTNFVAGATTVNVSGSGVTVNNVVVGSSTSLTASFVLDPTAATDARTVTVTTAAGTSGAQTFTISLPTPGAPTLTSVSPNQGTRGTTVAVTLAGTDFVVGATTVTVGGIGVMVASVTVGSGTSLTANFVIDPAAADGFRTVTVSTTAGTSGARIFTISPPAQGAPTLTSVTPNEGIQGTTVAVTLTGISFVVGATTVTVAGGGVTVNNVVVGSGTSLTASLVLDPAASGARTVTVTTAGGTSGPQTFTIDLPPGPGTPTLTSVSPNQGLRGTTVAVTLTGTNFVDGATTVNVGGGGVTVTNVVVVVGSSTSLTASFVLDPAAGAGPRIVTVTTAGGTSVPQGFTITLPPPTLTGVSPNQGIQGTTVAVTLTGTNFVGGATTVTVSGSGVTVANVIVGSATTLTASLVLDPVAAEGPRTVTVTTAGGTSGPQTFTISLSAPTLTSVSPNQGVQGTTVAVTLTGTNFVGATTVAAAGGGVTVTNVVVGSSTSLTANFVLDPAAVAGPRIVTVTTVGGTSGPQTFAISLPTPTLTSVSPNQGIRGQTVAVTLTGTNFVVGPTTVAVAGGGVTVTNVMVGSSTSLTASFVLDATAAGGPRTVTVTTAGGTSGAQPFTINLPPPGSATFTYTGGEQLFTVPAGVVAITIDAKGAAGGKGSGAEELGPARSMGGRTTATVSVVPGTLLTVRVGGSGQDGRSPSTAGGFNGGGASAGNGGGGGGASSVRDGSIPLVIAGGGGGGGGSIDVLGGVGGAGGGLTAAAGGSAGPVGGGGGGGGTQAAGGGGGARGNPGGTDGTAGIAGSGGTGGIAVSGNYIRGGGGGGGGYFGGGGGGGGGGGIGDIDGGGGGGGSSFTAPGATGVVHEQGVNSGNGSVTISW